MAQYINTNIASLNSQRNLSTSQSALATSLQRLSSGLRINSAKDDAAGMAISSRMTSQVNGLNQAARNANDAISLSQTAEGGLANIGDLLQRIRDLSVQSANDTNTSSDRSSIQNEVNQLTSEIDRVATQTAFNGNKLLDGSLSNANFQVGANASQTISMSISSARITNLGVGGTSTAVGVASSTTAYNGLGAATINGTVISASQNDGVSFVGGAQAGTTSALAAANAITAQAGTTGVTATASSTVTSVAMTVGAIASGGVVINGVNIGAVASAGAGTVTDQAALFVQAANAVQGQTGVTAALGTTAGTYTLTAADGRNIDISGTVNNVTAGIANSTTYGQVTLHSGKSITTAGATAAAQFGVAAGTFAAVGTALDVTTQGAANTAITSIDAALSQINVGRAALGAYQNRFTSAIANLQSSSENITAARSRIQDTDFAAETGALTRAQILQQAGTAMLAQANSVPNGVMALLR